MIPLYMQPDLIHIEINQRIKRFLRKTGSYQKKLRAFLQKSEKVILISSFVNLINFKKKKISEDNQIQSYKDDNFYKKSKYETEKFFYELQNK